MCGVDAPHLVAGLCWGSVERSDERGVTGVQVSHNAICIYAAVKRCYSCKSCRVRHLSFLAFFGMAVLVPKTRDLNCTLASPQKKLEKSHNLVEDS